MKIIVIGANGQLGSEIVQVFQEDKSINIIPTQSSQLDITNHTSITDAISKYSPDVIISTAAFHHVDECEANPQRSFDVNAFGVRNLCIECKKHNITLVHFSTDHVFGADRNRHTPYKETDIPSPVNVYGLSKLTGEYFIQHMLHNYFLIRTSGLFGSRGISKYINFVDSVIDDATTHKSIEAVNDQILSPTYASDLASTLHMLLTTKHYGLYHITNSGQCSWFQLANEVIHLISSSTIVTPITSSAFYSPIQRPLYSVLANDHLKSTHNTKMKPWRDALKRYIKTKI